MGQNQFSQKKGPKGNNQQPQGDLENLRTPPRVVPAVGKKFVPTGQGGYTPARQFPEMRGTSVIPVKNGVKPVKASLPENKEVEREKPVETEPKTFRERTQVRSATIVGRNHIGNGDVLQGGNNQDALFAVMGEDHLIAVICDGCSQGKHAEVGSKLLARSLVRAMQQHRALGEPEAILAAVQKSVLETLSLYINTLTLETEDPERVVREYFLSTAVGVMFDEKGGFFFGLGDGVYACDGEITVVEPSEGNKPIYIGYHLFPEWPDDIPKADLSVYKKFDELPHSMMIGSDGVNDLIDLRGKFYPGTADKIGDIKRVWEDPRFLENNQALLLELRRLQLVHKRPTIKTREEKLPGKVLLTAEVTEEKSGGLLPDDTTLAVITIEHPEPEKKEDLTHLDQPFGTLLTRFSQMLKGRGIEGPEATKPAK